MVEAFTGSKEMGVPQKKEIGGLHYEKLNTKSGEWVYRGKNLLNPENPRREQWRMYLKFADPRPNPDSASLYERLGIMDPKYAGLLEYNLAVGAGTRTVASMIRSANVEVASQAGAINGAGRRYDLEEKDKSREVLGGETVALEHFVKTSEKAEGLDTHVVDEMRASGCSDEAIIAALNIGRLPDRYIKDPIVRMEAIKGRELIANIVSYVNARTINNTFVTLEEAKAHYLKVKPDQKSQEFFKEYWPRYFGDVEDYLKDASGGSFNPEELTDDRVFETVVATVEEKTS